MYRVKLIALISAASAVLFCSQARAENPSPFVHRSDSDYMEYVQIDKMVLDLEYGVKEQDLTRFLRWFLPDSTLPEEVLSKEKEDMKAALLSLFPAFNSREIPSRLAGKKNTWDFRVVKKDITFSPGREEAWLKAAVGFTGLPGDPAVLDELPSGEVSRMSSFEKEMSMKFRPVLLHLKKNGGIWKIVSFGDFAPALDRSAGFYLENKSGAGTPLKKK